MTSGERAFAALVALRASDEPAAAALSWAWRDLTRYLDSRHSLCARDHDDVRQRALLKVFRFVSGMGARDPAAGLAWLGKVWRSALNEHHRSQGTRMMEDALRTTPMNAEASHMDRRPAPRVERGEDDPRRLDQLFERVLEQVHAWLAAHVKRDAKRAGDYRRAEIALLANIQGLDVQAIVRRLGEDAATSRATLYKWVQRGREEVLIPALEAWDDPLAAQIVPLLKDARRADAGEPRPGRRRSVSPGTARASRGTKGKARSRG